MANPPAMESVRKSEISSVTLAAFCHARSGDDTLTLPKDAIGIVYSVEDNQARLYRGGQREPLPGGATLLRWSLGAETHEIPLCTAQIAVPKRPFLVRCDRVDFPAGGVAYTHTHAGPGIRVLLSGELAVTTEAKTHVVQPGDAWFESGPEPVFAQASATMPTSFVRVMVLPAELHGKSSIRYVNPEDQEKPKTQRYQVFIDETIA